MSYWNNTRTFKDALFRSKNRQLHAFNILSEPPMLLQFLRKKREAHLKSFINYLKKNFFCKAK